MENLHFDTQSPSYQAQGHAFFALLIIGGHVLTPLMVLCAFFQRNQYSRSPILMNLCYSIIFYSTAFCLSFYAGVWDSKSTPDIGWSLCGLQTILVYVAPLWMCVSTLCLSIQLWFAVFEGSHPRTSKMDPDMTPFWPKHTRVALLTAFPYCVIGSFTLVVYMAIVARPELVGLRYLFCGIAFQPLRTAAAIGSFVVSAVILIFLGDIGRRLYTRGDIRLALAQMKCQGWNVAPLFIRICLVMIPVTLGLVSAVFAGSNDTMMIVRVALQSTLPLLLWSAFGTNPAIYLSDNKKFEFNWFRKRASTTPLVAMV